jgi:hypothetical protein
MSGMVLEATQEEDVSFSAEVNSIIPVGLTEYYNLINPFTDFKRKVAMGDTPFEAFSLRCGRETAGRAGTW